MRDWRAASGGGGRRCLELAATKTQLEVATDAAAKARLAAKTDTDRDAALAEARDQRVVNERLRVELEAAKEAAAEARLAADEAVGAAAKLSVGRDSDSESGSDSGSRSGPASNARREVWVTVQVPVLETDDSKTSLSSRVVPALVDIARSGGAASPRRARRSPRRDSSSSAGSSSRARRRTEAKTRTPSRAPPSPWTWRFPPSACSAMVTARTSRERVGWCSPSRMTRPIPESSLASSRFSTRPGTPKAPAGVFSRFAAAHQGAPPAVEFLKPHARLTFAIAVDASAAASVERSFRRSMFERMTSRASTVDLRDVTVRLARDAATTNAAVEAAAEHSANVLSAIRRDSSRGGLGGARAASSSPTTCGSPCRCPPTPARISATFANTSSPPSSTSRPGAARFRPRRRLRARPLAFRARGRRRRPRRPRRSDDSRHRVPRRHLRRTRRGPRHIHGKHPLLHQRHRVVRARRGRRRVRLEPVRGGVRGRRRSP